ncbi:hypothetical protein EYF80_058942 [Liparis tanakae]|uniref:Uncharacterized protein n=1 Tax=Liparis tanakae TaxID=230148 RepID=A0A4Z2EPR9_9TELE|nr:hypothetical protein EYF80_058942 [Liparis tanakae]
MYSFLAFLVGMNAFTTDTRQQRVSDCGQTELRGAQQVQGEGLDPGVVDSQLSVDAGALDAGQDAQSVQASLPGMCRSSAMIPRESSCSPLSWRCSWSPTSAVFRASSLLFCSTDTQLRHTQKTKSQEKMWFPLAQCPQSVCFTEGKQR